MRKTLLTQFIGRPGSNNVTLFSSRYLKGGHDQSYYVRIFLREHLALNAVNRGADASHRLDCPFLYLAWASLFQRASIAQASRPHRSLIEFCAGDLTVVEMNSHGLATGVEREHHLLSFVPFANDYNYIASIGVLNHLVMGDATINSEQNAVALLGRNAGDLTDATDGTDATGATGATDAQEPEQARGPCWLCLRCENHSGPQG